MRRIFKVLLPYYNKSEVEKEIDNNWIFDCGGRSSTAETTIKSAKCDCNYTLFSKSLFKLAHSWCTHIDYEEYCFLLTRIYERVTCKVIIKSDKRDKMLPTKIVVSFPEEEKKVKRMNENDEGLEEDEEGQEVGWVECDDDESVNSDFEYKYRDDNEALDMKRYKRPKHKGGVALMAVTHIKDPFLYKEEIEYDFAGVKEGDSIIDQLIGEEYVLPFGYPTEQFLFKLKNDVHEVVKAFKEKNKNNEEDLKDFNDPGLLKEENQIVEQTFYLFSNNAFYKEYRFVVRILDVLYNNLRFAFRE